MFDFLDFTIAQYIDQIALEILQIKFCCLGGGGMYMYISITCSCLQYWTKIVLWTQMELCILTR